MTLAYLAAAWLLGTVAAALGWTVPWPALAAATVLCTAIALARRRPQTSLLFLLAAAAFAVAFIRFDATDQPFQPGAIAAFNDTSETVTFRAVVTESSEERTRSTATRLQARELRLDDERCESTDGGILLYGGPTQRYKYGDLLQVSGKLETPQSSPDFDFQRYLAEQGVGSTVRFGRVEVVSSGHGNDALEALDGLRSRLSAGLEKALPEPQAALAAGILLGKRSALPPDLNDDLNATGTSHIIALSGYNVTLLAGLVIGGLAWLIGRRKAAWLALAAIVGYVALTGASPSLVRAAIMGVVYLAAMLVGRPNSGLTSLLAAGAVMAGFEPAVVRDVSFQLSFAATAGLIVLEPPLRRRIEEAIRHVGVEPSHSGPGAPLLETGIVTLAANLATLPLIALQFGRVSLISLPANLIVLPVFPAILLLSTVTALVGLVWQAGAVACGWFAWLALTYMLEAVRFFAALPLASLEVRQFNMAHAVLLYVMLGVFTWWLSGRSLRVPLDPFLRLLAVPGSFIARPLRSVPAIWPSLALSMAAALVWLAVFSAPDGRLTLRVLDVGQGDAILIDTPDGRRLLIDGGPGDAIVGELGEGLPFSERDIDLVVVTHPEQDHITGLLDVLDRYDVKQVMASPVEGDSETSLALRELIDEKGIEYTPVTAGTWIDLGRGARLQVLAPQEGAGGEPNDKSLVLKLTLGEVSFLLTGDIGFAGETALLANSVDLRATVLKVPHHGSAYATGGPLLAAVKPVVSVISVSADNTFGHPAPPTLDRLSDTIVYRTDEQGAVTFSTDGERLWVQPERNPPPPPLSMNR